jgi:hypothetical protein
MNMKKAAFFLILFFSGVVLVAQITPEKTTTVKNRHMGLEFSGGYSLVMGNYGAFDKANKKAGYAASGWQGQLTFDWMGKRDFGMALQYTYQKNPLQDSTEFLVPDGWSTGTLGPGSWSNHYLLLGPVYMKQLGKIHLDAKIMGGVVISSSANFTTPDPTDSTGLKNDVNLGTGFAYGISAGVGYAFSSHIAVKFNLSLMGGWPGKSKKYSSQQIGYEKYTDPSTGISYTKPVYSAPVEYEIKKVVFTLNPSIGLVYRF